MNALYFAMMATRATGGSMTKADTDAICSTCGAKSPTENEFCSNGFHAPGKTYWPDADAIERAAKAFSDASGYYVPSHPGLSWPSADKLRAGIRAALKATELADLRNRVAVLTEALAECRLIVANLPHDEDLLLRKIDIALSSSDSRGGV